MGGNFQQRLTETCLVLYSKIHTCIDSMLKQDIDQPLNVEDMDIDKFIEDLDPDVWQAICLLTQPLSARAVKTPSHV